MSSADHGPSQFEVQLDRAVRRLRRTRVATSSSPVEHPQSTEVPPTLTIGLATYDDFDGAYFTVTSLLLHHAAALSRCEIVILDNHPEGPEAQPLQDLAQEYAAPPVRYIPFTDVRSTAVRDVIFSVARTPWVMVVDSHVLLAPGALDALLRYIDDNPDSRDLIQGPMVRANGEILATHMDPVFRGGMYGTWGIDDAVFNAEGSPFEIPLHGLATFVMRTSQWPGINPRFTGFGGEEGYVHERVRQAGGVTLCLPALQWHHRFARPAGIPYSMDFSDRVNNYLVGWREVGWDTDEVHRAFSRLLGDRAYLEVRNAVERRIDHPGNSTAVCIASDEDRVGPWRRVLTDAEQQALKVERVAVSRAHDKGWWDGAIERVGALAARRRWRSVTLIDEQMGVPVALFYRVLALSKAHPGHVLRGMHDGQPKMLVAPESLGLAPEELVTALRDPALMIEFPLTTDDDPALATPEVINAGWTINDAEDHAEWESVYPHWAAAGMNTTMHRLAALGAAAPNLQHAFGWAEALSLATESDAPVIIARSDIRISMDAGPLLAAIVREISEVDVHLVSLSTEESRIEDGGVFTGTTTSPDAAVALITPAGVKRLTELLPRPDITCLDEWGDWLTRWGDVSAWLAALSNDGTIVAAASRPQLAVTYDQWRRARPTHAGRMQREYRALHQK